MVFTAGYFSLGFLLLIGRNVQIFKKISISFSSLLIAAVCIFFALHRLLYFSPSFLDNAVSCLVYPFLLVQNSIVDPFLQLKKQQTTKHALLQKIDALQEEKERIQQEVLTLQAQSHFMGETEDLRAYKNRYVSGVQLLAQVIFKQLNEQEQFFLINKGAVHTIKEGMVAVYRDCLVGKITQVFPYYSKVTLVTDKKCNVAAFAAETHADGIVEGCNKQDRLSFKFVSHLQKMKQNDRVLSSGQGLVFPHGFGIGSVQECYVDGLYYCVHLKPLLEFDTLRYCYIIQKSD